VGSQRSTTTGEDCCLLVRHTVNKYIQQTRYQWLPQAGTRRMSLSSQISPNIQNYYVRTRDCSRRARTNQRRKQGLKCSSSCFTSQSSSGGQTSEECLLLPGRYLPLPHPLEYPDFIWHQHSLLALQLATTVTRHIAQHDITRA
jgi:hypothetical protein